MAYWAWVLADDAGAPLADLSDSSDRRLRRTRNRASEASVSLSLEDDAAVKFFDKLNNTGVPQLRVYRSVNPFGVEAPGTLVFSGYWEPPISGAVDQGSSKIDLAFADPFRRLERRFTDALVTYSATDAGAIAWDLIDDRNTEGETGIKQGTIATTKVRDRTYENKQVAEGIVQLTEVLDGFDFSMTPLDASLNANKLASFEVHTKQGADQEDVRFEFGAETLANLSGFSFTTPGPTTKARVLGADGLISDRPSTFSSIWGIWQQIVTATDVTEQATLDDKAEDLLRNEIKHVYGVTADPKIAPQPVTDFDVGDTVRVGIDTLAISEQRAVRVSAWEIGFGPDGVEETLTVEFDSAC